MPARHWFVVRIVGECDGWTVRLLPASCGCGPFLGCFAALSIAASRERGAFVGRAVRSVSRRDTCQRGERWELVPAHKNKSVAVGRTVGPKLMSLGGDSLHPLVCLLFRSLCSSSSYLSSPLSPVLGATAVASPVSDSSCCPPYSLPFLFISPCSCFDFRLSFPPCMFSSTSCRPCRGRLPRHLGKTFADTDHDVGRRSWLRLGASADVHFIGSTVGRGRKADSLATINS